MYSEYIDSVKFLFSDKFTISVVNDLGILEMSPGLGCQSVASGSRRSGSHFNCDLHNSGSESERGMEMLILGVNALPDMIRGMS